MSDLERVRGTEAAIQDGGRAEKWERRWGLCINVIAEVVGCIVLAALAILLCLLFLAATPPQSSAESDLEEAAEAARSDMEAGK